MNLYHTNRRSGDDEHAVQQNCLRVTASVNQAHINRQIMSYCMSEVPIKQTGFYRQVPFAELARQNITSEQLYDWSVPIDIIEDYQFYVNQLSTSDDVSQTNQFISNCTLPQFGPMCEYEFEFSHPNHLSLYHLIRDFYRTYAYKPTEMTCYMHLQCDRGPAPACLDWSEICDGRIDCRNDALDEEHCWQLEVNECEENEYRCPNGQCIPQSFLDNDLANFYCFRRLDGEKETIFDPPEFVLEEPSIGYEDRGCSVEVLTSNCLLQRQNLLIKALFSAQDNRVSDKCWSSVQCLFQVSDSKECQDLCENEADRNIINQTCPDMMFFPAAPVLFNDIYFVMEKKSILQFCSYVIQPYECTKSFRYAEYSNPHSQSLFDSFRCSSDRAMWPSHITLSAWVVLRLMMSYDNLRQYNLPWKYTSEICNRSTMYQCQNSSKCISVHRLLNGIPECPYADDEGEIVMNKTDLINQIQRYRLRCSISKKFIYKFQVQDDFCNCRTDSSEQCEDEYEEKIYIQTTISFQTICDGFAELFPILVKGQNETDETNCEQWSCNSIYTHCDGVWNCPNGEDETDCYRLAYLNCSSSEHLCLSPSTNQFICLPSININDDILDCLGGWDEPKFCRTTNFNKVEHYFTCADDPVQCFSEGSICSSAQECINGEDEQICQQNLSANVVTSSSNSSIRLNPVQFLREKARLHTKQQKKYFALNQRAHSIENETKMIEYINFPSQSLLRKVDEKMSHCHRGLDLQVWSNRSKRIVCLCPPSYYGPRCQYQNQRVSLSIQFQTSSDSWQTLLAIVVSLIHNNEDERIVHSYEQFSYLSARDCNMTFSFYLLYSTRPKNASFNYQIHIDIYEKRTLKYRSSRLIPIEFSFLPVYRLTSIIRIPRRDSSLETCSNEPCMHGKCLSYSDDQSNERFCQCHRGWSGRYCTIAHHCRCSFDSLCLDVDATNQSICVCPMYRFGSRCLIIQRTCECENGGQCILNDEYIESKDSFICLCPRAFTGRRCEIVQNRLIVSFDKEMDPSQVVVVHLIEPVPHGQPRRLATFQTLISKYNSINMSVSPAFQIVFIEMPINDYYLAAIRNATDQSETMKSTIHLSDRCPSISQLFPQSFVHKPLIQRIKSYHLACQNHSCFFDDVHLCLCYEFDGKRLANCLEFLHNLTSNCSNRYECEHAGQCFLDSRDCPTTFACLCPVCFYGVQCQFIASGFGLTLDAILGYHLSPQLRFSQQSSVIHVSLSLTIIFVVAGLLNGFLSIITFQNAVVRKVGCGLYLLGSSITTLFIALLFGLKFAVLIYTQLNLITNRSFLSFHCHSTDFLLHVGLTLDQWLNACVATERTVTIVKGVRFQKAKSRQTAKYVILLLILVTVSSAVHDAIYRRLIEEQHNEEKRLWCIVTCPDQVKTFDSLMHSFHILIPFAINLISMIILIVKQSRQKSITQKHQTYREHLLKQLQQHKHLIIAPVLLVLFALPRLIIAFAVRCMKSIDDSWIFLLGYFFSFVPPMLTFIVFILPSKFYKGEFQKTLKQYHTFLRRRFRIDI